MPPVDVQYKWRPQRNSENEAYRSCQDLLREICVDSNRGIRMMLMLTKSRDEVAVRKCSWSAYLTNIHWLSNQEVVILESNITILWPRLRLLCYLNMAIVWPTVAIMLFEAVASSVYIYISAHTKHPLNAALLTGHHLADAGVSLSHHCIAAYYLIKW